MCGWIDGALLFSPQTARSVARLSGAVDAKEPATLAHTRRVAALALAIARELDLDPERRHIVALGALLHDVGKIGTPDAILLKPGPLSGEEQRVMQKHSLHGWHLLRNRPHLRQAASIARAHHERWDGSGYPDGLRGHEIPLEARIVSIADVYDALSSHRPYRRAWPRHLVIDAIVAQRGTTFDPTCVDALLRVLEGDRMAGPA